MQQTRQTVGSLLGQAEVVLEESMSRSKCTPIVLVVDCLFSEEYKLSPFSRDMTSALISGSVPMSVPAKKVVELSGELFDPEVNQENSHFVDMYKQTGKPFGMWEHDSSSDPTASGYPWLSWPFRSGTHYILFQETKKMHVTEMAGAARIDSLGPVGYVFMGGGENTLVEVNNAVVNAMPQVLLKNTGRVTQQWSLLYEAVKKHQDPSGLVHSKLLQEVKDAYPEEALKPKYRLTLPNVTKVCDIYKARPEVFVDTISVVDPLEDSPEKVLNVLSRCFSSTATGAAELGVGAAQQNWEWALHRTRSSSRYMPSWSKTAAIRKQFLMYSTGSPSCSPSSLLR